MTPAPADKINIKPVVIVRSYLNSAFMMMLMCFRFYIRSKLKNKQITLKTKITDFHNSTNNAVPRYVYYVTFIICAILSALSGEWPTTTQDQLRIQCTWHKHCKRFVVATRTLLFLVFQTRFIFAYYWRFPAAAGRMIQMYLPYDLWLELSDDSARRPTESRVYTWLFTNGAITDNTRSRDVKFIKLLRAANVARRCFRF